MINLNIITRVYSWDKLLRYFRMAGILPHLITAESSWVARGESSSHLVRRNSQRKCWNRRRAAAPGVGNAVNVYRRTQEAKALAAVII